MKISNVRLGFATNSSSSHSIVIVPKNREMYSEVETSWDNFGWENFVLTTPESKTKYLAYQVAEWLKDNIGYALAIPIIKEWYGVELPDSDFCGVDHQSIIQFPRDLETNNLSKEFLDEFEDFLNNSRVAVLGGNDNGDDPDSRYENRIPSDIKDIEDPLVTRKISNDWWSIFNQRTGAKIRLSFVEIPKELTRANAPELVDLKITDYCPFDCSFCYQDSTLKGTYAPIKDINEYLYKLKGVVFEIAFGGGEPTLHPDFPHILRTCKRYNIIPNFTTKVMTDKWSKDVLKAVQDTQANFAVSVDSSDAIYELKGLNKIYNINGNVHFVVGAYPAHYLRYIIDAAYGANISLTLLGYKTVGRGKETKPYPQDITSDLFERSWRISVDTAFLDQYAEVLKDIPNELKVSGEGTFSMYIDAVNKKAGSSSYHVDSFIDYDPNKTEIDKIWSQLNENQDMS